METVISKLEIKLKKAPKGTLFVLSDFTELGSYESVKKAIQKLVKNNNLISLMLGIYKKPNYNNLLEQEIPSSPDEIAYAYARKNNWNIAPSGDLALNKLGLSTQVPNIYQYISSGPSKKIMLENGHTVEFRHVAPKESVIAPLSSLIIEALKTIGKDNITSDLLKSIIDRISRQQFIQLKKDVVRARSWVRDAVFSMEGLID